jgi:membrane protein
VAAPDGAPGGWSKLRPLRVALDFLRVIPRGTVRRFFDARGPDLAASLAYSSLLTVVPLVASVTLLTSTFFGSAGTGFYRVLRVMVPGMTRELAASLQTMALQAASLTGTASLFFFVTSLRTFFLMEGAARELWGATATPRTPLKRVGLALFFMILGPVAAGVVTSFLLENGASMTAFRATGSLLTIGLVVILYRLLPGSHVRWGSAVTAGTAAGLALTGTRLAFTRGIAGLAELSVLYGSVTAIVVFVLAVGVAFGIFLLGVSFAHALQFHEELRSHDAPQRRTEQTGPLFEAVRLLLDLAVAWRNDRSTRTLRALSNGLGRPETEVQSVLATLAASGLVVPLADGSYELSRAPDQISLYAVARAIGESAERPVPSGDDPIAATLRRVFSKANREERGVLQGTSLRDLIVPPEEP